MNATMNESSCPSTLNGKALTIGGTIAYCLIFIVSLIGNSFIALIVYKTQSMRKPINYFITNMAMSDLLFPIFLLPICITKVFYGSGGPLGHALCKLTYFLPNVSTAVSVQSLVLIAVDRFGAVVFPLRPPLITSKLCPLFIIATWIVAVAVMLPYLFAFRRVEYQGLLLCQGEWKEAFGESFSLNKNYFLSLNIACFFFIPVTFMITLYSIILIKLKTQKHPGEQSVNAEEQRARRNRNVLKMSIAIVIGFVLCFLPWSIINILLFYARNNTIPHCNITLYETIFWLMYLSNCVVNPSICFSFNGNYRQGFKKLIKCNK